MGCVDLLVPVGKIRTNMCLNWQLSVWTCLIYGITVSALMEAHLVLGFLARAFRWTRFGSCLDRTMVAVWLAGAVATAVDASLTKPRYDPVTDACEWSSPVLHGLATPCMILAVAVSMAANCGCYLLLTASARPCCCLHRTVPANVEARDRQQSCRYIFVALITWLPYLIAVSLGSNGIPGQAWIADVPGMITSLAISLNGAMNFWAYAWHNRHLKHNSPMTSKQRVGSEVSGSLDPEASFNVGFASSVDICVVVAPENSLLSPHEDFVPGVQED